MARWQPDGRLRLQRAAVDLYAERGFHETTVAAVAERAGLTERTFFRHFADKREVLFAGEEHLREQLTAAVVGAEAGAPLGVAVRAGLAAVVAELQPRHADLRRREAIVAAHPELRERELTKLASWSAALEGALAARGAEPVAAALGARVAIAALDVAARAWIAAEPAAELWPQVAAALDHVPSLA